MTVSGKEVRQRLKAFDRRLEQVDELEQRLVRAAAVVHHFDPLRIGKQLDVPPREVLRKLAGKVQTEEDEDGVPRWSLRLAPRQRALRELGTAQRIRGELEAHSDRLRGPVQRAFEELLEGPIAPVESLDQPAIRALQIATQWLESTEVPLPFTIEDLERPAELARLRAELRGAAGPHFQGRAAELSMLGEFAQGTGDGPILMLWARGGLGKSALVAEFLSRLGAFGSEAAMPVAYLDFDHSSLDVRRPLTLMHEIASQLELQHPGHFSSFEADSGMEEDYDRGLEIGAQTERYLQQLGWLLEEVVAQEGRALLVLETFERAQSRSLDFAEKTVNMMRRLSKRARGLRVLVAGRAPAAGVRNEQLDALDTEAANALLQALGIADEALRDGLVERIGRSPLAIKLAARLAVLEQVTAAGLEAGTWDDMLNEALVEGELYRRVLEHIDDRQARQLAHPGLVLRSLNERLILEVLAPTLGVEIADLEAAKKALAGLRRVHDLVRTREDGALELRPSIRRSLLPLIARDERRREKTRKVHQAAAAWFDDEGGPRDRAEAIYHYLMLGRVADADKRWSDDLASYFEEDDLLELPQSARSFLAVRLDLDVALPYSSLSKSEDERIVTRGFSRSDDPDHYDIGTLRLRGDSPPEDLAQRNWERRAASRVRDLMASGELERAREVLNERTERLPDSLLFRLEVEVHQALGDDTAAAESIERALEVAARQEDEEAQVELLIHRARVHENRDQLDAARSDWDKAVELARTSLDKADSAIPLAAEVGRTEFLERHSDEDAEDLRRARLDLDERVEHIRTKVLISDPKLAHRTAAQLSSAKGMLRIISDVGFKDVKPDLSDLVSKLGGIRESGGVLRELGSRREAEDDVDRAALWSSVLQRASDQGKLGPALKTVLDQFGDLEGVTAALRGVFAEAVLGRGPTDASAALLRLQELLGEAFPEEKLRRILLEQFGSEWVDALPEAKTRTGFVFAVVNALRRSGYMLTALQAFASSVSRQQAMVSELSAISEALGFAPIVLEDPFSADLLFGRSPYLDQSELRERCRQLASEEDGPRVLLIKGIKGSGRTYVARFLEHVSKNAGGFPSFDVTYVNVAGMHRDKELFEHLVSVLGAIWVADSSRSRERRRGEMVDELFHLIVRQQRRTWIVFDSLSSASPELELFIEAFLEKILESKGDAQSPRLVFLDHPEPERWSDEPGVLFVELSRITREDVREFLRRREARGPVVEEIIAELEELLDEVPQPLDRISHILQEVLEKEPWT